MKALKPISRRLGRIGLALAVLVSLTAVAAGPAAADNWHHHNSGGFVSFGFEIGRAHV